MSYKDFQQKVYSSLIKYKKEYLKIEGKGVSARGVYHDCLLPKPYSNAEIPVMLYDGIKTIVEDIQKSKYAYKPHLAASVHVASSQTACINLFVPILECEYADYTDDGCDSDLYPQYEIFFLCSLSGAHIDCGTGAEWTETGVLVC